MYQRIMVALGEEPDINDRVLAEAIAIASASKGTLNLIHVLLPIGSSYSDPMTLMSDGIHSAASAQTFQLYLDQWQSQKAKNQKELDQQANALMKQGLAVEWTQAIGDPGRQICKVAQDWKADLILLGRHNRSGIAELLLGSVSNYVMHHADCSVIAVQSAVPVTSA